MFENKSIVKIYFSLFGTSLISLFCNANLHTRHHDHPHTKTNKRRESENLKKTINFTKKESKESNRFVVQVG
jgi:hypothetical protein